MISTYTFNNDFKYFINYFKLFYVKLPLTLIIMDKWERNILFYCCPSEAKIEEIDQGIRTLGSNSNIASDFNITFNNYFKYFTNYL